MSQKGKIRRERYQERQAQKGTKIFNWLLVVLGLGAVALLIFYAFLVS